MAAAKTKKPRDAKAATQPSVRVFTTFTPAMLRAAELSADGGHLRSAASICEWILGDDRARGVLSSRVEALLGLDPTFERTGDKRRSNRAVKALEAGDDWFVSYPESFLSLLTIWGILLGVAPGQHQWTERRDHGGRVLPMPAFWHPISLRLDHQTGRWMTRVDNGAEIELVPGDSQWILHTPYGQNRPWALGLWRGLARWVLLKQYAIEDWARHSEKGAILVATSPADTIAEQRKELAADLQNAAAETVCVLPNGFSLDLIEASANTETIYKAQIEMANEAIAVAVRGGNLTTITEGGSRAAANTQERLGDAAKLRFDAQSLTTTIHDQSLNWWAEFNFGDAGLAPWPVYPVEPKRDIKTKADVLTKVADGAQKLEALGFEIDRQKFAEEFDLATFLKPGEKREPPAPVIPGDKTPPKEPEDDSEESDETEEDDAGTGAKESPEARVGDGVSVFLASGASAARNTGFVDGQQYIDRLVAKSKELGAHDIKDTLDAVIEEVEAASSYQDLRERLAKRYAALDPGSMQRLVEKHLIIAELAGHTAVLQDL